MRTGKAKPDGSLPRMDEAARRRGQADNRLFGCPARLKDGKAKI